MSALNALPAGLKVCPGWTSEFAPEGYINQQGYGARGSGHDIPFECGGKSGGRRGGDPAVIRDGATKCARCAKQKAKYDQEHGLNERRERESKERYESLIAEYVEDLEAAVPEGATLQELVTALDALEVRSDYPPHVRRGEAGYRSTFYEPSVPPAVRLNVLRQRAGLPIVVPERGYR